MDQKENEGRKAMCLLYFVIFIILFIITWVWVYYSNFKLDF